MMRENADQGKIKELMKALSERVSQPVNVYFTGGATAVLLGMRSASIDVDLKFEPDIDEVYRAIREIKEKLRVNIELASPDHFIPPLPGWKERSIFIDKIGPVSFYHYDLYSQVLSKIERGWKLDLLDAKNLVRHSVNLDRLINLFHEIQTEFLYLLYQARTYFQNR